MKLHLNQPSNASVDVMLKLMNLYQVVEDMNVVVVLNMKNQTM